MEWILKHVFAEVLFHIFKKPDFRGLVFAVRKLPDDGRRVTVQFGSLQHRQLQIGICRHVGAHCARFFRPCSSLPRIAAHTHTPYTQKVGYADAGISGSCRGGIGRNVYRFYLLVNVLGKIEINVRGGCASLQSLGFQMFRKNLHDGLVHQLVVSHQPVIECVELKEVDVTVRQQRYCRHNFSRRVSTCKQLPFSLFQRTLVFLVLPHHLSLIDEHHLLFRINDTVEIAFLHISRVLTVDGNYHRHALQICCHRRKCHVVPSVGNGKIFRGPIRQPFHLYHVFGLVLGRRP